MITHIPLYLPSHMQRTHWGSIWWATHNEVHNKHNPGCYSADDESYNVLKGVESVFFCFCDKFCGKFKWSWEWYFKTLAESINKWCPWNFFSINFIFKYSRSSTLVINSIWLFIPKEHKAVIGNLSCLMILIVTHYVSHVCS